MWNPGVVLIYSNRSNLFMLVIWFTKRARIISPMWFPLKQCICVLLLLAVNCVCRELASFHMLFAHKILSLVGSQLVLKSLEDVSQGVTRLSLSTCLERANAQPFSEARAFLKPRPWRAVLLTLKNPLNYLDCCAG